MSWWEGGDLSREIADAADQKELELKAGQAAALIGATAALIALWPVGVPAVIAITAATLTGMPPVRLVRAAAWSSLMIIVYGIAAAAQDKPWQRGHLDQWAEQPYRDWLTASKDLIHGTHVPAAILTVIPLGVPLGLLAAAALWQYERHLLTQGLAGETSLSASRFDEIQWKREARTAARDARQPGRVPLASRRHGVTVGTVIRTVRAPWTRVLSIPLGDFQRHMVIVGASGSGKTTLMMRLWAGWWAAAQDAAERDGAPRPLLVVLDAKGGHDSRDKAADARAALTAAGAKMVVTWPDFPLDMWGLPAQELAVLLHQLIPGAEGNAQFYSDMSAAVITLAVHAPEGPPRSPTEFLTRLDAEWLESAYLTEPAQLSRVKAARQHVPDILMRYQVLLGRLGPSLAGKAKLADADVWYCILEGTAQASVAEAQALALIELVAKEATSPAGQRRRILLAADDYSAVAQRVPLANLYERGRSLGLGVQVSAQSWEGLGADEDERKRITSTADGGIWLMRMPDSEKLTVLAGTRTVLESGRKLLGAGRVGDEGSSRAQQTFVASPDRVRQLETGQTVLLRRGTATYAYVVRV